jgi:hypothetical protein
MLKSGFKTSYGRMIVGKIMDGGNFLTTIKYQGGCEKEQPKVGPKGEREGTSESNGTD